MRWKIIIFNALIVVVVGALSYALLATSISDVVQNPSKRKVEAAQALRAASAQLALDALRLERWMDEKTNTEAVREVYAPGTPDARSEAATVQANKLRDAAVGEPSFAKMAPSLVMFVDQRGVVMGRNGSALMRGDKSGEAYPSLAKALETGNTGSAVWLDRARQEQMLTSYAPIRGEGGEVIGALVVGTPLNDDRLSRTSELTSGQFLALGVQSGDKFELVASSGQVKAEVVEGATSAEVQTAAKSALTSNNVVNADVSTANQIYGAVPLAGYQGKAQAVLVAAVPASLVGSLSGLLWPIFGVTLLGVLLVIVTGTLLGNYFSRPVSELEDGLLAIINGRTDLRFQIEHPDLGGLVFRINSLLNQLMGVPEDTSDEEGRQSIPATSPAVFEDFSAQETANVSPEQAQALAAEPADAYYARLFNEYIAAKRQLGEPVDHITQSAFVSHIRQNEQQAQQRTGHPVRYRVEVRNNAVALVAIPIG